MYAFVVFVKQISCTNRQQYTTSRYTLKIQNYDPCCCYRQVLVSRVFCFPRSYSVNSAKNRHSDISGTHYNFFLNMNKFEIKRLF